MSLPDDLDFQFLRCRHGWSNARLYINGNCHEFFPTHIFADPLEAICLATVTLAKGFDEGSFSWFDEPGQYDWRLTRNSADFSLLDVLIYVYSSNTIGRSREGSTYLLEQEIAFRIERDFWIDLVTLEAEKIAKLMTYKHYKSDLRPDTFPWRELKQLQQYRRNG